MAKKFFVPPPRKPEPPKEEKPKSYLEKFNARVGKSKILSAFVIGSIILAGIGTATGHLERIGKAIYSYCSNEADSVAPKPNIDSLSDTLKKDSIPNLPKKNFFISDITLTVEEKRWLEDTLKMEYSANEKGDSIWLKYNKAIGSMTVGSTTRYQYGGSSSIRLMNGKTVCHEFTNGISAYSEGTTKKEKITDHINNSVTNFVQANKDEILHHIILCLKK
jgi:hypothetical protein